MSMETTRKLGPIALIAFIAAIVVAVPIFSATSIINGVSIPASSNRFSMMSITGRSTKTAATDWHQLTPANPASGRSVACRKVVVKSIKHITSLPQEIMSKANICIRLTVANGSYSQWRLYPPFSSLSKHDKECVGWPPYRVPGLSLSPSGVLNISPKIKNTISSNLCFAVEASSGHKHFTTALWLYIIPPSKTSGIPITRNNDWAGYDLQGKSGTFNGVSATFNVPRSTPIRCNHDAWHGFCDEAIWAGVGGGVWSSGASIIQAGISERVVAGTHKISHLGAWFELYPAPNLRVNLPVHQGDQVSVNIHKTVTTDLWSIQITNDTTGQTFSTLQFYTGSTSSAEWIVEAPGWANFPLLGSRSFSLPTLTPVTFTHPQYSLTSPGDSTQGIWAWLFQRHTHAISSHLFPNGSFTVVSFPTTSKKGKL